MKKNQPVTVDQGQKERETQPVSILFEGVLSILCLALFTITPLLFVEIKQNEWVSGFIPIRMINAELKFCAVIVIVSLITGLIGIRIHLNAYISRSPPLFNYVLRDFHPGDPFINLHCTQYHPGMGLLFYVVPTSPDLGIITKSITMEFQKDSRLDWFDSARRSGIQFDCNGSTLPMD